MLKKNLVIICCIIGINLATYAQYNAADSNYINASILLKKKNYSALLEIIQEQKLDPNYYFNFPKDSLDTPTTASSSNSSGYSSGSSSLSGAKGIGGAIASIISGPLIALGKILGALGNHRSHSTSSSVLQDSLPKTIQVVRSNLLKEMLMIKYFGQEGNTYKALIAVRPISDTFIDSLLHQKTKLHLNALIGLACFTADTSLLAKLEARNLFDVDSTLPIPDITLSKPILLACYFNNTVLLDFLMRRNVNPLVKSEYYKKFMFTLGPYSGITYIYSSKGFVRNYSEHGLLELTKNKETKKCLKTYIKNYKKQLALKKI